MVNEKQLIDRNEIFPNGTFFANAEDPMKSLDELIERIWSIPTVDAVEVVHGRWNPCGNCGHRCSKCDFWVAFRSLNNYCPNCGAKMDGDGNGNA